MTSAASLSEAQPAPQETAFFRPTSKKRKLYRQKRATSEEATPEEATSPPPAAVAAPPAQSIDELIADVSGEVEGERDMAAILKLRKMQRRRGGGVEFRAEGVGRIGHGDGDGVSKAVVRAGEGEGEKEKVGGRFTAQTGFGGRVGEVDRHM